MGAASYFEDIEKRRDEALSQLTDAGQKDRVCGNHLDDVVRTLKRIVEQEYAKILNMMDIITSPEMNIANEYLKLKATNASLEESRDSASKEIAALKRRLDSADQTVEILRTRTRRLDRELHGLKQRKRSTA